MSCSGTIAPGAVRARLRGRADIDGGVEFVERWHVRYVWLYVFAVGLTVVAGIAFAYAAIDRSRSIAEVGIMLVGFAAILAAYAYWRGRYTRTARLARSGGVVWRDRYGETEERSVRVHVVEVRLERRYRELGRTIMTGHTTGRAVIVTGGSEAMTLMLTTDADPEPRVRECLAELPEAVRPRDGGVRTVLRCRWAHKALW